MTDLPGRLAEHIRNAGLFPAPGTAVLAVSGGPDSVALLELFGVIGPALGVTPVVGHVDHGISPGSADVAEAVFGMAVRLKIRAHLRSLGLGPDAGETRAREERYRALRDIQHEIGAEYLVTAHHADDQVETTLLRFLRGSAPAGLAGIQSIGPEGLIRPLLPFKRTELLEWLSTHNAPRATHLHSDTANTDPRHDRSWLRHHVLPELRARFPRVDENLLDGRDHALRDREAWTQLVRTLPVLDLRVEDGIADVARTPLQAYDKALCEALLRAVAREAGCLLGPTRARKLADLAKTGASGRILELGEGWEAELVFDRVRISRPVKHVEPSAVEWGKGRSGGVAWGRWQFDWQAEPAGESPRGGFSTWVSVEPGQVRGPRGGDQLFPLGGVGHRSVRRLLMEARVPRSERIEYPVIVRDGALLWVPGVCRSASDVPRPGEPALRIDARHA